MQDSGIKRLVSWVILLCLVIWPGYTQAADTYVIDPDHSSVAFRIKHLGITFVYGVFFNAGGVYAFEDSDLENASIWLKVKVADIDTGNIERDRDLMGPDFFDEHQFPLILFKSESITASGDGQYVVTGELSLHGVTRSITAQAVKTGLSPDPAGGYRSGFEARFSILRSDFGMRHMTVVADRVELTVSVEGVRIEDKGSRSPGVEGPSDSSCGVCHPNVPNIITRRRTL